MIAFMSFFTHGIFFGTSLSKVHLRYVWVDPVTVESMSLEAVYPSIEHQPRIYGGYLAQPAEDVRCTNARSSAH